ncbi:FAD-dependent oxidoreductase [Demequina mangrovi]|uniref:Assimilatory nitrate reductase (NADH) beta subunit n=1 Tax=Demequina mangrovi TaxID=1043493 RepID=A0A1H6UY13_9MICO|nr:FAD-dependent oxidoreductase [Demequina mangrovi]SEI97293.1 assimilatory nitrate reductase (NADH) beta subunit [Demequina mangrovi]
MRIVVIGHGMVGSRFAQDAATRIPDAHVTVLGREPHEPYNRVLLSSVVAGKAAADGIALDAPPHERIDVRQGVSATEIDRDRRIVTASDGSLHRYDRLVLATGSAARIPQIQHVATPDGLVPGVSVLKDLADAQQILGALPKARRAVVLGAGVLGLEVATGLAARGLSVTLVHHADRLMERQLGSAASAVAEGSLGRLGISVVTTTSVTRVIEKRGRISAVLLGNGAEVLTDLLVMCAGTIPETALARRAGLPCERGVVVDDALASPEDGTVFAIGDCAQPPEGGSGLVAQGWDQAARLVDAWAASGTGSGETTSRPRGEDTDTTNVVRVKATGLDVVTMGLSGKFDHGERDLRAVRLSDPAIGRFVEVVVSHGLLVGATVVGDKACATELQALYTRMLPVPSDPAHLIVRPVPGAGPARKNVTEMDDDDTVCQCNGVSKGRICAAIADGCDSLQDVSRATRASTGCGDCKPQVKELLAASAASDTKVPALAGMGEA